MKHPIFARCCVPLIVLAFMLGWPSRPVTAQDQPKRQYVGIEISSTAVRVVMIEHLPDGSSKQVWLTEKEPGRETRTGLITTVAERKGKSVKVYSAKAIENVVEAVKSFFDEYSAKYKLEPNRFVVVASSGVVDGTENINDVSDALKKTIPSLPPMDRLSPEDEVRLPFNGLIPKEDRAFALLVDIGGSNTKIGFPYTKGDKPDDTVTKVKFGTNTLQKAADILVKNEKKSFIDAIEAIRADQVVPDLTAGVRKIRMKKGTGRDKVFAVGGAPFAMVTLMFPSRAHLDLVTISYADLKEYKKLLRKNRENEVKPFGELPDKKEAATKWGIEFKIVKRVFTMNQLLSGAEMLEAVFSALELNKDEKTITFSRKGLFAWLTGYVEEKTRAVKPSPKRDPGLDEINSQVEEIAKQVNGLTKQVEEITKQAPLIGKLQEDQKKTADSLAALTTELKRLADKVNSGNPKNPTVDNPKNPTVEALLSEFKDKIGQLDQLAKLRQEMDQIQKLLEERKLPPVPPLNGDFTKQKDQRKVVALEGKVNATRVGDPSAGGVMAPKKAQARITVYVPEQAKLYVDNVYCPTPSGFRSFDTPSIDKNRRYHYTLKIEWIRDGQIRTATQRVNFEAGGQTTADLRELITSK